MNIAILAPSPVPFTIGGVESLVWGLCDTINKKTTHKAELLKLPSREFSFWDLIDNYYQFYSLDLSHFDAVIVTKYPAWMIRHKNVIYYIQHRLRGLYDTYHFSQLPKAVERGNADIDYVLDYMKNNPLPSTLDDYFDILNELREKHLKAKIDSTYFNFPGPFIRQILIYLDNWGMSQNPDAQFYSISETVKKRTEYFPSATKVEVVYHPSTLEDYKTGEYKYVFMVSRLDEPKRIDLLIKAMQYVKSDIKLYIAGTGPAEKKLKELAGDDSRIEFLGFVNDDVVEEYYSNCLVVPYFPFDEDLGLITIEAMMRRKPVITTVDAGGPTEFVKNNETGFVVAADPKDIAEKIEYFATNPREAERMGSNAYKQVCDITWENTVESLLSGQEEQRNTKRSKITITTTYPIYPPMGGGQSRIYNLYTHIAKTYDIEVVGSTSSDNDEFIGLISPGLAETRVPRTKQHEQEQWDRYGKEVGVPIEDIAMLTLSGETPRYGELLEKSFQNSDFVIISHPFMYNEAKKYMGRLKFAYEAHNVEYLLKKDMLPDNKVAHELLELLFKAEKECCEKSEFVFTCSKEDATMLVKLYGISGDKIIIVPNGVDCRATTFTDSKKRSKNKKELKLENETLALFIGSWHGPNNEACEHILKIAEQCPDIRFLLMGSQCNYIQGKYPILPKNVGLLGPVSGEEKNRVFSVVDFALNPMTSGSGTNLKMFDYMSAGIPVITTNLGARGIENKDIFIISEINDMAATLSKYKSHDFDEMTKAARHYTENTFDWSVISKELCEKITSFIE